MGYKSSIDLDWSQGDIIAHVTSSMPPGHGDDQEAELGDFIEGHDWELIRDFDPRSVWTPRKAKRWLASERRQSIKECGEDIWGCLLEDPTDCPAVLLYSGDEFEEIIDGNHRMAAHAVMGWPITVIVGRPKEPGLDLVP
jgi:hypothetical protein